MEEMTLLGRAGQERYLEPYHTAILSLRDQNATAVINRAAESVRPLMVERNHQFEVSYSHPSLELEADPIRLEQILVNLLTNAMKYTPDGGRIRLTAVLIETQIIIRIIDSGIGIANDVLPHIFELFAQGERALARTEAGLGIGLTIVKKLVELHGGSVSARNDGFGRGSTFTVRLPAAKENP
jgi:signal transduction histidine kinase